MVYPSTSSRWCPTPEQLMILEEMYRAGLRTPKAAQIEQITAHLSLYGKIEGKNVFYWFQNHKARERQKLKRKLQSPKKHNPNHHHHLQQYYESLLPFAPQIMYCIPVGILPQGGVEVASPQMMTCSWKLDPILDQRREMDSKFMERTNDRDWVVVLDVGPGNKPLKTLELFPTAANGLKDECTTFSRNPGSTTTN